jgi:hypothetical protein
MKRIYVSTLVSVAAAAAAVGLIAGCSSGNGSANVAATSTASSGSAAFSAYTQCLSQHGVTLPSGGFGGRRTRSPGAGFTPGAGRSYGGFGGGGGGAFASANPTMAAAMQACASLRPTGGAGFGGGSTRLTAFRNCMTQQGEAVPTTRPTAVPTAPATGDARYLNGLNPSDPKVAAALAVCKPLIPTAGARASASATTTTAG